MKNQDSIESQCRQKFGGSNIRKANCILENKKHRQKEPTHQVQIFSTRKIDARAHTSDSIYKKPTSLQNLGAISKRA